MSGVDLILAGRYSELFRGVAREHRQDAFRATHGFYAVEHLYADRYALRRRRSGANAVLCRAIPGDGVRATDLPRKPARYRSLPVGASLETLPHGLSRAGPAIDAGRCQRDGDWRIYAEFAHRLIAQARKLYANESLGLELSNTVYALDSTTIDLCLSLFPWAHFRSTKAAVKMHTL